MSAPTALAKYWIKDPFDNAMPIIPEEVKVEFEEQSVDENGLVTIVFSEEVNSFDIEKLDASVLSLKTYPQLNFNWTATFKDKSLTLKLVYDDP